jgi:hypothetical protein
MAIDQDLEPHRLAIRTGPENQMQNPGMETVRDPAIGLREDSVLAANPPVTRQRPLIERQRCGRGVGVNVILEAKFSARSVPI